MTKTPHGNPKRLTRRLAAATIALLGAITAGCAASATGRQDSAATTFPASTSPYAPAYASPSSSGSGSARAAALRRALQRFPVLDIALFVPPRLKELRASAEYVVTGRITGLAAAERRYRSGLVGCESGDGQRTGQDCSVEYRFTVLNVQVSVERVRILNESAPPLGSVATIELPVASLASNETGEAARAAVERVAATHPRGLRVVMLAERDPNGPHLRLMHPSAWAVVQADQSLSSLSVLRGDPLPGLAGARRSSDL